MGRITQTFVKRTGVALTEKYPKKFSISFEDNKKALQELIEKGELNCPSNRVRNRLAGCIVRRVSPKKSNRTYKPMVKEKRPKRIFKRR